MSCWTVLRGRVPSCLQHIGSDVLRLGASVMLPCWTVLRGIASRIQYGRSYPTFTLRYKRSSGAATEFEKRLYAIRHGAQGYIYPHLTIQAYISRPSGRLLAAAVTETSSLYL